MCQVAAQEVCYRLLTQQQGHGVHQCGPLTLRLGSVAGCSRQLQCKQLCCRHAHATISMVLLTETGHVGHSDDCRGMCRARSSCDRAWAIAPLQIGNRTTDSFIDACVASNQIAGGPRVPAHLTHVCRSGRHYVQNLKQYSCEHLYRLQAAEH